MTSAELGLGLGLGLGSVAVWFGSQLPPRLRILRTLSLTEFG